MWATCLPVAMYLRVGTGVLAMVSATDPAVVLTPFTSRTMHACDLQLALTSLSLTHQVRIGMPLSFIRRFQARFQVEANV